MQTVSYGLITFLKRQRSKVQYQVDSIKFFHDTVKSFKRLKN